MDLYNKLVRLCTIHGYSPSALCEQVGISRSFVSDLKSGRKQTISAKNAKKITDFLGVPIYELLGDEYQEQPPQVTEQEQMLQDIKDNPDLQILFSMTRNASKEDIRKVIDIFKIMKGD